MNVGVADQYMIMMAVTLLFTVLALAYDENIVTSLLAGLAWLISAIGHFAIGDPTSPLTISLSWLFVGIGLLFIVKTLTSVLKTMRENRYGTTEL